MDPTTSVLRRLWAEHRERRYPRGRPSSELGSVDEFDLVSLDTFMAGYLSRVVEGETLEADDASRLNFMAEELRTKLRSLSGSTYEYFSALEVIAQLVLSKHHKLQ